MNTSLKDLLEEYKNSNSSTTLSIIKKEIGECMNIAESLFGSRGKTDTPQIYYEYLELFDKKDPVFMEIFRSVQK